MANESARLIASFIVSVGEVAAEDGARCVIEEPHHSGVADFLVEPAQALGGLLQIAELMRVGGDCGGEALLDEMACGLHLASAMKAAERAEIDQERAVAAQRLGKL